MICKLLQHQCPNALDEISLMISIMNPEHDPEV